MKFTKQLPTKGNFVAVWEYKDKVWSDTFLYKGEEVLIWNEEFSRWSDDKWEPWNQYTCKFVIV